MNTIQMKNDSSNRTVVLLYCCTVCLLACYRTSIEQNILTHGNTALASLLLFIVLNLISGLIDIIQYHSFELCQITSTCPLNTQCRYKMLAIVFKRVATVINTQICRNKFRITQ